VLKKYWIWTSSGLLILGSIEAWLSGFSYIPFAWVLAVMNSVVALVIKGLATFFRALRKLFSPINYEPLLVASDFQHNASKSHRKDSHSAFNDPLDPSNPDNWFDDFHFDPIFNHAHPLHDLYDDFR
jgi:hypothetical protein